MGTVFLSNSEQGELSLSAAELVVVLFYCYLQCSTGLKFLLWWAAFPLYLENGLYYWMVFISIPVPSHLSAVPVCLCQRDFVSVLLLFPHHSWSGLCACGSWKGVYINFPVCPYLGNQTLPYICTQSCTRHSYTSSSSYRLLLVMVQR